MSTVSSKCYPCVFLHPGVNKDLGERGVDLFELLDEFLLCSVDKSIVLHLLTIILVQNTDKLSFDTLDIFLYARESFEVVTFPAKVYESVVVFGSGIG